MEMGAPHGCLHCEPGISARMGHAAVTTVKERDRPASGTFREHDGLRKKPHSEHGNERRHPRRIAQEE